MKKNIWLLCAILIIAGLIGVSCLCTNKVSMDNVKKIEACFKYENVNTLCYLNDKETEAIKAIFNGKKMYKDNLSCGFNESVSLKFDKEQTFCIAQDSCPIIYWKEKDRYIKLSKNEKIQLYELLEPYGFFFPCV